MQYLVPPIKKRKQNKKGLLFKIIIIFLVLLFVLILLFGLFVRNKQNKEFEEQRFYFVCANKSRNLKEIEEMQENIQKLGGAGKVYFYNANYYLVINVYYDEESAKQVVEQNKEIYPNSLILEQKTKLLSKSVKQAIKNNTEIYEFLKYFNKLIYENYNLMFDYLNGNITENELCSKLLTLKFDFDDVNDRLSKSSSSSLKENVINYSNLLSLYYSSFFNSFFDSTKKGSIVCDFAVNLALLKIDFFNNL